MAKNFKISKNNSKKANNKEKVIVDLHGCKTDCIYFPYLNKAATEYYIDENNVKRRKDNFVYVCGYDGHIIRKWDSICPRVFSEGNNNE